VQCGGSTRLRDATVCYLHVCYTSSPVCVEFRNTIVIELMCLVGIKSYMQSCIILLCFAVPSSSLPSNLVYMYCITTNLHYHDVMLSAFKVRSSPNLMYLSFENRLVLQKLQLNGITVEFMTSPTLLFAVGRTSQR